LLSSHGRDWSPSFIGTVTAWTRVGRRDILFIVNVRAVGNDGIMEWTLTKPYLEFKTLKSKLKGINSGTSTQTTLCLLSSPSADL
jgi:hypothetical protein